jgi:telomere length regulation protein
MLAAEVIAQLCGQKLSFGDWDGDDQSKPWCRALRKLVEARDVDAPLERGVTMSETGEKEEMPVEEITTASASQLAENTRREESHQSKVTFVKNAEGYDSDDSMEGYASEGDSDRSVSPTPEELAEIEKDPTLNVGKKKVPRPVYLAQLGALLQGTGTKQPSADDPHEADRVEMALDCAEELIRRKRAYGTELGA